MCEHGLRRLSILNAAHDFVYVLFFQTTPKRRRVFIFYYHSARVDDLVESSRVGSGGVNWASGLQNESAAENRTSGVRALVVELSADRITTAPARTVV